jgi:hypothetical protein
VFCLAVRCGFPYSRCLSISRVPGSVVRFKYHQMLTLFSHEMKNVNFVSGSEHKREVQVLSFLLSYCFIICKLCQIRNPVALNPVWIGLSW